MRLHVVVISNDVHGWSNPGSARSMKTTGRRFRNGRVWGFRLLVREHRRECALEVCALVSCSLHRRVNSNDAHGGSDPRSACSMTTNRPRLPQGRICIFRVLVVKHRRARVVDVCALFSCSCTYEALVMTPMACPTGVMRHPPATAGAVPAV